MPKSTRKRQNRASAPRGQDPAAQAVASQASGLEPDRELHPSPAELEHIQRLATIGTIAASIAHEINNLLTPVLSYAQLAKAAPGDAGLRDKAIERTIAGVEAVERIARSILAFAAPGERGKAAGVSRQPIANVRDAVDAALLCLAREPAKDGIQVSIRVPQTASVAIDPLALQQVILNLLLNACRAMKPRGGELTISAEPVASVSKGEVTIITVADSGPGLSRAVLARLFQPFSTGAVPGPSPSSQSQSTGGSGLGLSICRHIIAAAGGSIVATNAPVGAVFTITLLTARQARAEAG